MIFLIGGETHTGKTKLAQLLLERYHFPYLSLDHLKMGLYRSTQNCTFTPEDTDDAISSHLWPIVKGMIDTCIENGQNQIIEGCYLPPEQVKPMLGPDVAAVYLVFSEDYLRAHYDLVLQHENVIEQRLHGGAPDPEEMIAANASLRERCITAGVPVVEIRTDHDEAMARAVRQLGRHMISLRSYRPADLPAVCRLFHETVHTVCAEDYSQRELDAWAPEKVDLSAWNRALRESLCVVATAGGEIVGFANLAGDLLDRVYVHADWQRRGVGTAMVSALERVAGKREIKCLSTDASITARPFFQALGYRVVTPQKVVRGGVVLTNFRMEKVL